jgi:outer membrane protein
MVRHRFNNEGGGMKHLYAILSIALLLAVHGDASAADLKIGFVDLQRALNDSEAGEAARARFVKEMEAVQVKLRKEKEKIDRMREDFDKKAMLLREKERRNMEQDLEDKSLAFKRKYEDYQKQMKRADSEYTGSILRALEQIIRNVGERDGYTVIFEAQSSGLVYADPATDLTDEIVRTYNASAPSGKKK